MTEPQRPIEIGIIFSEKKIKHTTFQGLIRELSKLGHVTIIDFSRPIAPQGHFHIIYHKLTDWMNDLNEDSKRSLQLFEEYTREHSHVLIIEPVQHLRVVLDRLSTFQAFSSLNVSYTHATQTLSVRWPPSLTVGGGSPCSEAVITAANIRYPLLAKPAMACGLSSLAHQFLVAYSYADLERTHIPDGETPYLLQRLVPHRGTVLKVYVIGRHLRCSPRESLPLEIADPSGKTGAYSFNSQHMPKTGIALTPAPPMEFLEVVTVEMKRILGLELFGYDLIESSEEPGVFYLVDINYLPSYTDIPNAVELLFDQVRSKWEEWKSLYPN